MWFTCRTSVTSSQGLVEGIGKIEVFDPNTKALRKLTDASRQTLTPLSIGLAGSTAWSLQSVACVTGVGHYRVVGCTGASALTIWGCTRITTVDSWTNTYKTMGYLNISIQTSVTTYWVIKSCTFCYALYCMCLELWWKRNIAIILKVNMPLPNTQFNSRALAISLCVTGSM